FSDCRHGSEPGCAIRRAIEDGTLDEGRLDGFRKLERELAFAERREDPRARAAEAKRWRQIHKDVGRKMDQKYGKER
ncbi:MAG: ribosome biosis GTPase / thiamine phosphate phosphatase, partial [Chloroflexota bacterium]|nr:ribosome biosis GTPase / thiamine phosphate phosphatase [Chloroflexota bacterium]